MSFASIRSKKTDLVKLQQEIQESGKSNSDPRIFKHSFDKQTNVGTTLIRFLPRYDSEGEVTVPWITWKEFNFDTPAGTYWERSRVTLGESDPVADLNKLHWASIPEKEKKDGVEAGKARKRNVKSIYMANIVVLDDPVKPENNGKVFAFKFKNSIKEKLEKVWMPEYSDITPIEFFDWQEGANFRIRTKTDNKGWFTYEDSAFEGVSPLAGGDIAIQEKLYNAMIDLSEFETADNYKSYEELEAKLIKVLGAREIARIRGEEYSVDTAVKTGENAFNVAQATTNSTNVTEAKTEKSSDPFANIEKAETTKQTDPFAGAKTDSSDPFANLNVNG